MKGPGKMLNEVWGSLFKKPATQNYPFEKKPMPDGFRGKIEFTSDQCIGCRLCMKDCPSSAIEIVKVGEKRFECHIDLSKCIYCAQCVDSCMKKALMATDIFELADLTRKNLKIVYNAPPPAPPVDTPPPTAAAGPPSAQA